MTRHAGQDIDPVRHSAEPGNRTSAAVVLLAPKQVVQYGIELCEALEFSHRQDLIHRDIKPSNIIFVQRRPKIADIGLVTNIGTEGSFGAPGYIPPEGPGSQRPTSSAWDDSCTWPFGESGEGIYAIGRSPSSGRYSAETLQQLENIITKARRNPSPQIVIIRRTDRGSAIAGLRVGTSRLT